MRSLESTPEDWVTKPKYKYAVIKRNMNNDIQFRHFHPNAKEPFIEFADEQHMIRWAMANSPSAGFMPEFIRYETLNIELDAKVTPQ
jgi:hypothetical protein